MHEICYTVAYIDCRDSDVFCGINKTRYELIFVDSLFYVCMYMCECALCCENHIRSISLLVCDLFSSIWCMVSFFFSNLIAGKKPDRMNSNVSSASQCTQMHFANIPSFSLFLLLISQFSVRLQQILFQLFFISGCFCCCLFLVVTSCV